MYFCERTGMIEADSSEASRKACQYEPKTESTKERSPTELRCASFPIPVRSQKVHRSALRTLAFLKVLLATTTLTRLLSALSRSHIGPGARWGSISNQAPSQKVTGPGGLGAAI